MPKVLAIHRLTPVSNQNRSIQYKMTVPTEWVQKHGLEKGGKLLISEDGDKLVVEYQ